MDIVRALAAAGFSMPSPAFLFGALLLLLIGRTAYRFGDAYAQEPLKWIGATQMLCPLLLTETWLLYAAGSLLCLCLFLFRPRLAVENQAAPEGEQS